MARALTFLIAHFVCYQSKSCQLNKFKITKGPLGLRTTCWWGILGIIFTIKMSSTAGISCVRLGSIQGYEERVNDVILSWGSQRAENNLIFFGGDVQDYEENMLSHRDNKNYVKWNLESTARLLQSRFPASHIWVIKPSRMHLKTFSVYSNFVESSDIGVPTHSEQEKSWHHLNLLLKGAVEKANSIFNRDVQDNTCSIDQNDSLCKSRTTTFSSDLPIHLVGFSKGCVVLNQFLYELESAKSESELAPLVSQVQHMFWLDGGHNGGSNTWIVHKEVLRSLVDTGITVHAHVTPYQVKDAMRKWIGKEQKKFVQNLEGLNVKVFNQEHFEDEERSIDNHFRVIEFFDLPED